MITLEEFKKKHSDKCRLIGLDLGANRIGVSICDEKQLIATPHKTINRKSLNVLIDELRLIINDNNIKAAAFSAIFFSLLLTLISNWLDRLKAPTVESLSSQRQIGISKFFSIFSVVSFTD